jgi:hypothetical protein
VKKFTQFLLIALGVGLLAACGGSGGGAGGGGTGGGGAQATQFSLSGPGTSGAGFSFTFSVTARDAANNVVTDYAGTVHFTSSDPTALLPADSKLTN